MNKLDECQGKCRMILYWETHMPWIEGPHIISCDNDRSKPLEQPSMDLTWSHLAGSVKLLLNVSFYYFVVRSTIQPRAATAWVWSNVLYPDSEDKGSGLGGEEEKTTTLRSPESLLWMWRLALQFYANMRLVFDSSSPEALVQAINLHLEYYTGKMLTFLCSP